MMMMMLMLMMMMMMMSWIVSDFHVVPIYAFPKVTNARFGTGVQTFNALKFFRDMKNQCNGHDRSETRQGTAGRGKTRQGTAKQSTAGHGTAK